ncbi:MAG: ComF family protein [Patescibacteria group bacterium]
MTFLDTILDLIFPVNCVACGKKGQDFCLSCLYESRPAERETSSWIYPLFDYRHPPIKKAIWLLKYKGKRRLAEIFGEVIYGRISEELSELAVFENFREPILIPIPLSSKRMRERGFNQAELICRKIKKMDTENVFTLENNILIKPKDTKHQAQIENRSERLKNLTGSFAVQQKQKIQGRNIILIDDVTTTGATFNEAKKILKANGAKKVIAFAVAH